MLFMNYALLELGLPADALQQSLNIGQNLLINTSSAQTDKAQLLIKFLSLLKTPQINL